MEIDVPVTGTNYAQGVYDTWCRDGADGYELDLQRDPGNVHDRYAVKVLFRGLQMGWVAKTHSKRVAEKLDANVKVDRLQVLSNWPGREPMDRLRLRLTMGAAVKADPPGAARHIVKTFGAPSRHPETLETLKQLPVGTVLYCESNVGRISIDLLHKSLPIAWFRKQEPGAELHSDVVMWANRGALVARVESQKPLTVSLHRKGDIKETPASSITATKITPTPIKIPFTPKENTMNNFFSRMIAINTKSAGDAAYLETGRIANNTVIKMITARLPFMARFYARTPFGKLATANAAIALVQQLRPNDARLQRLVAAMTTVAYQEVIQLVDIEGMIDELMANPAIKRALDKTEPASKPGVDIA